MYSTTDTLYTIDNILPKRDVYLFFDINNNLIGVFDYYDTQYKLLNYYVGGQIIRKTIYTDLGLNNKQITVPITTNTNNFY